MSHRELAERSSLLLIVLLLSLACEARSPNPAQPDVALTFATDPGAPPVVEPLSNGRTFYPLGLGSRWLFQRSFTLQFLDEDGNPSGPPLEIRGNVESELVQTEVLFGREYVVERSLLTEDSLGDPIVSWLRQRQDRSGLYAADVNSCDPPGPEDCPGFRTASVRLEGDPILEKAGAALIARGRTDAERSALRNAWSGWTARRAQALRGSPTAEHENASGPPGGLQEGEFVRLRYPLRPGAHWELRPGNDVDFAYTVEVLERLQTPAGKLSAYRVRVTASFFGPDDLAYLWFGTSGFVGLRFTGTLVATGPDGKPLGMYRFAEVMTLDEIDLISEPRP